MKSFVAILGFLLLSGCTSSPTSATPKFSLNIGAGPSLGALLSFDHWPAESATQERGAEGLPGGKEGTMGRWAKARRNGGPNSGGLQAAPVLADFSLGVVTSTTIPVNRAGAIPAPADRWGIMVINQATRVVSFQNIAAGTPITATGLVTFTTYEVRIAWFRSPTLERVSEWSPPFVTTTP